MDLGKLGAVRDKLMHPLAPVALEVADLRPLRRSGVISDHLKSALGQIEKFGHPHMKVCSRRETRLSCSHHKPLRDGAPVN